MTQTVKLTFNGVTAEIKPVVEGMYDLNDIWRTFRLPEKKRPSEWRHRDRRHLECSENLRNTNGRNASTYGTKKALFMYAAWCDYEFHDAVFTVFQLVTEGKAEEALTASQKVVVDSGLMRERHGSDMDIIKKRQDDGKLKLHPNYCYSTLMTSKPVLTFTR